MNIVLSGGGTAGHINPALALAEVLEQRGHTVFFAGTPQGVEARLVVEAGIPFTPFEATGFNRKHPLSLVSALHKIIKSTGLAKKWFSTVQPDVVVGFGGYVSIPVGRAAESLSIPVVVHEQNSVMGMANAYLAKRAHAVALTYEMAGDAVRDKSTVVVTGNPVRLSVLEPTREQGRALFDLPEAARVILVFGGSLGARHINTALVNLRDRLLATDNLYVLHVTGPREYEGVRTALALSQDEEVRWRLFDYQSHMGEAMAASDMVVARAGATTLAEISARHIPALLVPFPFATADHQTTNARAYVERGAACMISDDEVESDKFADLLFGMINDASKREAMATAAATFETGGAASRLADVVIAAAK